MQAIVDAGIQGADLDAIGITNQRETVVAWDPETGEPVHRALVWQDRRTAPRCDELRAAGHEALVRERTGLVIDPYFSGTKIEWLRRNVEAARERRLRDDRLLARLQAHRSPRHRLLERLADDALRHPRAALGRRAVRPARGRSIQPARAGSLGARLRPHRRLRRRRPGGRDRGRPAGGAVRPGLPAGGHGQEHLRDRELRPPQHRSRRSGARRGPADDRRLGLGRRPDRLRARGGGVHHRRRRPVASRRARDHRLGGRERGAGGVARLERRRLLRSRADRPRIAALGSLRARDDRRPDPRLRPRPAGASRAGGDRLPDRGRGAGAGGGRGRERSRC